MTPFEALTEQDKKYITEYIETYGGVNTNLQLQAPLTYILRYWNENKQRLFNIFGQNLTLEKEIEVEDTKAKKIKEINTYFWNKSTAPGGLFISSFDKLCSNRDYFDDNFATRAAINRLMTPEGLYSNRVDIEFTYHNKDGKIIKVPQDAKVMRVLQKIAKEFDLPDFEAFRNRISRITEVRKSKLNFTLSIHPLDYMTMSDNDNDWESCMNWTCGPGGYRAGTVEMMNSPCVIVAYVSSKTFTPKYTDIVWNSKSWRELIIIDPNVITTVKSYPYYNKFFDKALVNWVADLIEANTDWCYNREKPQENLDSTTWVDAWNDPNDEDFALTFNTDAMYNDFGNTENYAIFSVEPPDTDNRELTINYSGELNCMCCGRDSDYYFEDETEAVVCDNCDEPFRCDCCGNRMSEDEAIAIEGGYVCENCYSTMGRCMICETVAFDEQFINVVVGRISDKTINLDYNMHFICDHCLYNDELKEFLNDDAEYKKVAMDGAPYWGVNFVIIEEDSLDLDTKLKILHDPYAESIGTWCKVSYPEHFYTNGTTNQNLLKF